MSENAKLCAERKYMRYFMRWRIEACIRCEPLYAHWHGITR
jgi:hypothetical protein